MSKFIKLLRDDSASLYGIIEIGKDIKRKFDAIFPLQAREFGVADIKYPHEEMKPNQPLFTLHLHTTTSAEYKWKQGDTHRVWTALKSLNIIGNKGLKAVISRSTLVIGTHG